MVQPTYRATLVSHTHWDRAWYVTFQEFRARLVRLIDRLLNTLDDDPDFRVFMLDGQMSVLEDYLEIRPEQAARLQAYCQSGRIQVGPWYVLADEFLVSPEALIRNLALGHKMGEPYGGVMRIGYVPDGFGHIAQLPQILRGFGLDNAFFWRGMGAEGDRLGTEFEWCAPDGSQVTAVLMPWGYHNVTNLGYGIHWGDVSQMLFNGDLAQEKIEKAIDKLKPMTNTGTILLMNGIDHAEAEPRMPEVIRRANAALPDTTIHHGTLAEHLAAVRDAGVNLPTFEGEFRWGRYSEILQGVYSTRIHLKQANHAGETLLERYMEPLTALAWLSGADIPEGTPGLAAHAWKWLLLNHPHDDMYGSGIDEVHHEMAYRFSQSRQIADILVRDSLRQIARQADMSAQNGVPVLLFNPLGWARREVAEATIEFEYDDPIADAFQIVAADGTLVPHQVIEDQERFWMEVLKANRKHVVRVLLPADLPAMGYTSLFAQPAAGAAAPGTDLESYERGMENSFLAVAIQPDGSLNLLDKQTGQTYTGLHHFFDVEDTGDEYSFCPLPEHSQTISTVGANAAITRIEAGPCRAAFRIERTLDLPVGLTDDRTRRAGETVPLPIVSEVRLYAGQPGVFIHTEIDNRARDHKLTVNFPTGLHVEQAHVDESFMVAARDLKLPDSTGWVEDPTALMHQRTFTDLSDGDHGLAILNKGLPSVEVTEDGTIALTLLRAVGWLSRDDLWVRRIAAGPLVPTPGAQCFGPYAYDYAILPHADGWGAVFQAAQNYNAPVLGRRADTHPGLELHDMNITRDDPARVTAIPWPRGGSLPASFSLVQIDPPELVLSAVRRSEANTLIVRCYNITREPVEGTVTVGIPVAEAYRTDMAGERQETLKMTGGRATIQARGGEVITLELVPA
ncbi:MAG TPA: glycoside hydrolase family 38 C-terminal domain-containing protein [Aggregatilinea sp.]|uniref:alpha-mannosidase n=1 Tax=Aggregatilinea sp. TaxID=2806333 RepID=UPI002CB94701|nr:glycoside hydrolase family 38 C-terminal domain-containing protein [Aggregatilinea sp.]HML20634.1 glycoside hydrolase family 38 C-terminal domain-containing protein [Aggregatilinea sp.]